MIRGVSIPGQRICVGGTSGAGKTYVAEALARLLGLRYVSGDELSWAANWTEVPRDERLAAFDQATRGSGWTIDTNIGHSPEDQLVLDRCDTIIWLDLPRWQVWTAITRRTLWRAWSKEPLWHGNIERWRKVFSRDSMIWWSIKTYARRRRQYRALFEDERFANRARIRLESRRQANAWLAAVGVTGDKR